MRIFALYGLKSFRLQWMTASLIAVKSASLMGSVTSLQATPDPMILQVRVILKQVKPFHFYLAVVLFGLLWGIAGEMMGVFR